VSDQKNEPAQQTGEPAPTRRYGFLAIPVIAFLGFGVFYYGLTHDAGDRTVPSALIGRQAPDFALPAVPGASQPGFARKDLDGKVSVINVWASWCAPCRLEHPVLMELGKSKDFQLFGLNYRDKPENARRYLGALGNPFAAVGYDESGRVGIDWGVYGQPETFIVSPKGVVTYKFVGPLSPEAVEKILLPEVARARTM
jgi:cytochrome c biogenesis protein CcmG/thiol:disulfide interchange protein DsbE